MSVEPREILDAACAGMDIDDECAVRDGTSFTWWPYRIRQTVRAYPPVLLRWEIESLERIVFGPDFAVELDDMNLSVLIRTFDGHTIPYK